LSKGYEVHGIVRRSSTFNTDRIDHFFADLHDPDARLFTNYGGRHRVPPDRRGQFRQEPGHEVARP